jgi:hypothetical protein
MIKVYLVLLFLFFPLTVGCSQNTRATATSLPQAKHQDLYVWDFGKVKKAEILKHDFILKNESGRTLAINSTNTSCGCTVSSVNKKQLLPGESAQINVEFNTRGYKGATQQFIYVNTDDPVNPVLRYIIKAFVE